MFLVIPNNISCNGKLNIPLTAKIPLERYSICLSANLLTSLLKCCKSSIDQISSLTIEKSGQGIPKSTKNSKFSVIASTLAGKIITLHVLLYFVSLLIKCCFSLYISNTLEYPLFSPIFLITGLDSFEDIPSKLQLIPTRFSSNQSAISSFINVIFEIIDNA